MGRLSYSFSWLVPALQQAFQQECVSEWELARHNPEEANGFSTGSHGAKGCHSWCFSRDPAVSWEFKKTAESLGRDCEICVLTLSFSRICSVSNLISQMIASLSLSLFVCLSICLSCHPFVRPSIHRSARLPTYRPTYLPTRSIRSSTYLPIYVSIFCISYIQYLITNFTFQSTWCMYMYIHIILSISIHITHTYVYIYIQIVYIYTL